MESECVAIATVAKGALSNWGSPWVEFALWSAPHNMAGEGAGYGSGHVGTVSGLYRGWQPLPWQPIEKNDGISLFFFFSLFFPIHSHSHSPCCSELVRPSRWCSLVQSLPRGNNITPQSTHTKAQTDKQIDKHAHRRLQIPALSDLLSTHLQLVAKWLSHLRLSDFFENNFLGRACSIVPRGNDGACFLCSRKKKACSSMLASTKSMLPHK